MPESSYRETAVEAFIAAKRTTDEWRKLAEIWDFQTVLSAVYVAGRHAAANSIREEVAERAADGRPPLSAYSAEFYARGAVTPKPGDPCTSCEQPLPIDPETGYPTWCRDCCRPATIADLKDLATQAGKDVTVRSTEDGWRGEIEETP